MWVCVGARKSGWGFSGGTLVLKLSLLMADIHQVIQSPSYESPLGQRWTITGSYRTFWSRPWCHLAATARGKWRTSLNRYEVFMPGPIDGTNQSQRSCGDRKYWEKRRAFGRKWCSLDGLIGGGGGELTQCGRWRDTPW